MVLQLVPGSIQGVLRNRQVGAFVASVDLVSDEHRPGLFPWRMHHDGARRSWRVQDVQQLGYRILARNEGDSRGHVGANFVVHA